MCKTEKEFEDKYLYFSKEETVWFDVLKIALKKAKCYRDAEKSANLAVNNFNEKFPQNNKNPKKKIDKTQEENNKSYYIDHLD